MAEVQTGSMSQCTNEDNEFNGLNVVNGHRTEFEPGLQITPNKGLKLAFALNQKPIRLI